MNCVQVVSNEDNVLKATHTTPIRRYIDDMTFTFYTVKRAGAGKSGCNVVVSQEEMRILRRQIDI